MSTDVNSGDIAQSWRRGSIKAALLSAVLVIGWIMFHLIKDQCWGYLNGTGSVIAAASLLFAWLFVFFVLKWRDRIILAVVTMIIVAIAMPETGNRVAAAESRAASILRMAVARLQEQRNEVQSSAYPATLAFETKGYDDRYYRYAYLPLRSHPSSAIDGFLLTARPRRYSCGSFASFTVGNDGKFHMTKEDRQATRDDPTLN